MADIPPVLVQTIRDQKGILFLGAGASFGARHPDGRKVPSGNGLRDLICDQFFGGSLKDRTLLAVSAMALNEAGFLDFQRFIRDVFEKFEPTDYHCLIPTFRWRAIATTNFDLILERAYVQQSGGVQNLVKTVKDGDGFDNRMQGTSSPVGFYKLHGCIDHYTDQQIPLVLGNEQYASYSNYRHRFYSRLKDLAYENSILFAGYSLSDPHIQQILFDLTSKSIERPPYYCVGPDYDDIEIRYWAAHRVTVIRDTLEGFLSQLDRKIPVLARQLPVREVSSGALSLGKHYRIANPTESEELLAYLDADAEHVHSGLVSTTANAREFYSGHDQGWGSIVQNYDVKRRVVDSVLVDVVLGSAEDTRPADLYMLKGPAGNGKTVSLKRIAWEAAISYEKIVIFAQNASGLRIGPLMEIHELTGKRIYLFVDHIALFRSEAISLLRECRTRNIRLTIIGAERDNEWNIYCEGLEPFLVQDFPVRFLTELEVEQLVGLLERHGCLGALQAKSPKERIDAFVAGAQRQLLVALHEVTLGLPFEKIVLDEYERVEPAQARRIYLEICALHQFGAPVRAGLISRSSGISFEEFSSKFLLPLENVVRIIEDRHTKDISYQARHSHVAAMVFAQALPGAEDKFDVLASLLDAMNVDYTSDRETFSRMIKGRSISEIFADVSLGRLFYDRAEEAAPNDAFVPHQRAVFEMAHSGGSLVLAEEAAQRAHSLNVGNHSIKHTLAEIARRRANATDDPLLKQSLRRETRQLLTRYGAGTSEYDYNTRARLAIDELKDLLHNSSHGDAESPPTQIVDAAKEAELAIERGLQAFPDSAQLLATEASFHELLQAGQEAVATLAKAFRKNPRQDWLAVRLARIYRRQGDPDQAITVLESCLRENPASKPAHLEMAHCLGLVDAEPSLILDHFRRAYTEGDSNFEAQFWHARELFVQDRFGDAERAFIGLHDRAPGRFRTGSTAVVSDRSGELREFKGEVDRLEEGYAFIASAHLPKHLFASRADSAEESWAALGPGACVKFNVAFNRRGPRAVDLKLG